MKTCYNPIIDFDKLIKQNGDTVNNTIYTLDNSKIANAKKYISGNAILFDLFFNGLIDNAELDALQGKVDRLTGYTIKSFDQHDNITTISNGSIVVIYDSRDEITSSYNC